MSYGIAVVLIGGIYRASLNGMVKRLLESCFTEILGL